LTASPTSSTKKVLPLIEQHFLAALNNMMAADVQLATFCRCIVKLLPKVRGMLTAAQFRPITILGADFKLLTKMFVGCLLTTLPDILTTCQLCSVHGRSIFDGAAAILLAVEYLNLHQLPGYVVNLDFFHAYDWVDLKWVDKVLQAFSFDRMFRRWSRLLHKDASAVFMPHRLSLALIKSFSLWQGDPLAMLLYIIQLQPLLFILQCVLAGFSLSIARGKTMGYVAALRMSLADLEILDMTVSDFETVSGALLNQNGKSVVVGLGSWAGRSTARSGGLKQPWRSKSMVWSSPPRCDSHPLLGGIAPKFEATLYLWETRRLPTLALHRQALEVFAFSLLWYLPQILLFPAPLTAVFV
jgi:Reverse transcriptase (RNA-dependent DNA polymerase)